MAGSVRFPCRLMRFCLSDIAAFFTLHPVIGRIFFPDQSMRKHFFFVATVFAMLPMPAFTYNPFKRVFFLSFFVSADLTTLPMTFFAYTPCKRMRFFLCLFFAGTSLPMTFLVCLISFVCMDMRILRFSAFRSAPDKRKYSYTQR